MPRVMLVPVAEYLATSYRPDREYLDGEVLERSVGEWDHSRLQALLLKHLLRYEDEAGLLAVPEQRVQVRASRFRVLDICVGVENTWIVDPRRKKAYWADQRGVHEWPSAVLETKGAPIRIDLGPLWPA